MDRCDTIKVKPWGKDQGEYVEINAEDYDPKVHNLHKGEVVPELEPEPVVETDPMPANPDDLVAPPPEQVANEEVVAASAEKPVPKPRAAKSRRKKKGAK